MLLKVKTFFSLTYRIFLALTLTGFGALVFLTLASKELSTNTQILTSISLVAVLFSLPGIINTLADEYNPKKKLYKLSCKCPNCRHLIEMDMKED
ncbi:hypothetical protein [Bacillus mesophilum]|uniref:Uncharacterized protein n=1 Tax=Bacillus mesophilum TaxID=1071718 RepID=A0A7V7RP19_9BACI|nr:hypothetical protein [Bacillus mesophilum]KAB2334273.1 hypothetical protein F7732_09390 [Bacillus mesophilum]